MSTLHVIANANIKFSSHTKEQCDFAIRDIHATLANLGEGASQDYQINLYAELDAARARQLELRNAGRATREQLMEIVTWAHAALGFLAITAAADDRAEYARRRDKAWEALCDEGRGS